MKSAFLLLAASLLASSGNLWAATTGAISGVLTDPSGAVIPGAAVLAVNPATGLQNQTTTDEQSWK